MECLTIGDIVMLIKQLQKEGMVLDDIYKLPVYLGDDDELNGIHTAWYVNPVDANNPDDMDFVQLINEEGHNVKLNGKAILIS